MHDDHFHGYGWTILGGIYGWFLHIQWLFWRMSWNLAKVLQWCEDTHLVLNWEKCHFIVKEGIVLGHKISKKGLELDRAKIEVIEKLQPPTNVKQIRSFLGHVGFCRGLSRIFQRFQSLFAICWRKIDPFLLMKHVSKRIRSLSWDLFLLPSS